jgi:hypothetical protein
MLPPIPLSPEIDRSLVPNYRPIQRYVFRRNTTRERRASFERSADFSSNSSSSSRPDRSTNSRTSHFERATNPDRRLSKPNSQPIPSLSCQCVYLWSTRPTNREGITNIKYRRMQKSRANHRFFRESQIRWFRRCNSRSHSRPSQSKTSQNHSTRFLPDHQLS